MKPNQRGERIPLQVGTELRIRNDGTIVVDNPEVELLDPQTADAVISYYYDAQAGHHVLRLLEPVADHKHIAVHRPDD